MQSESLSRFDHPSYRLLGQNRMHRLMQICDQMMTPFGMLGLHHVGWNFKRICSLFCCSDAREAKANIVADGVMQPLPSSDEEDSESLEDRAK